MLHTILQAAACKLQPPLADVLGACPAFAPTQQSSCCYDTYKQCNCSTSCLAVARTQPSANLRALYRESRAEILASRPVAPRWGRVNVPLSFLLFEFRNSCCHGTARQARDFCLSARAVTSRPFGCNSRNCSCGVPFVPITRGGAPTRSGHPVVGLGDCQVLGAKVSLSVCLLVKAVHLRISCETLNAAARQHTCRGGMLLCQGEVPAHAAAAAQSKKARRVKVRQCRNVAWFNI